MWWMLGLHEHSLPGRGRPCQSRHRPAMVRHGRPRPGRECSCKPSIHHMLPVSSNNACGQRCRRTTSSTTTPSIAGFLPARIHPDVTLPDFRLTGKIIPSNGRNRSSSASGHTGGVLAEEVDTQNRRNPAAWSMRTPPLRSTTTSRSCGWRGGRDCGSCAATPPISLTTSAREA